MTEQGAGPGQDDARATRIRWILRAVVLVVALWFIADGLSGIWPDASGTTRVVIVVAVGIGVALAALGAWYLARRSRPEGPDRGP